jgi:FAD/FMN-containing dehydrogenase
MTISPVAIRPKSNLSIRAMTTPFSRGAYVNNQEDEGSARAKEAHGPNYDRLVTLKNRYDPTNLFSVNQNVIPTVS